MGAAWTDAPTANRVRNPAKQLGNFRILRVAAPRRPDEEPFLFRLWKKLKLEEILFAVEKHVGQPFNPHVEAYFASPIVPNPPLSSSLKLGRPFREDKVYFGEVGLND